MIIHGMAEHQKRYAEFAVFLSRQGWVVCSFDLPGHGETASDPETLGYIAGEGANEKILADVDTICGLLMNRYPKIPLVILGHSMGSLIARRFCTLTTRPLAGAIFSGDVAPNPLAGLAIWLASRSIKKNGAAFRDHKLDRLMHRGFLKRVPDARGEFDWISKDKAVVDRYEQDPWCGFIFTANGFLTLFIWVQQMSVRNWANGMNPAIPVLYVYGEQDPVGGYAKGVGKNIHRLKANGNPVEIKSYENGRHEMLNEIERQTVWQDIADWLNRLV